MSTLLSKTSAILLTALTLASCTEEQRREQRGDINRKLPDGCVMRDLGEYGDFNNLIMIRCPNETVTTQGTYKHGKQARRTFAVATTDAP